MLAALGLAALVPAFTAVVPGLGLTQTETIAGAAAVRRARDADVVHDPRRGSTVAGRRLGERALRTASVVAGLAVGAFGLVFVVRGAIVLLGA